LWRGPLAPLMHAVFAVLFSCSSPPAPTPVAEVTDAETLDDEPAIVEHRCLPMVEGGERKLPEVSTIEAGPLSFTALTCPNPWAPSETYFLTIDEANGWSLTVIDPKRDWSGYILAKPSFGPMALQTDRLAEGVALTLTREDLSWGTGSQEVYLFDSGGQLLGEPLVTSPGPVRVEDGALLATNTHTQLTLPRFYGPVFKGDDGTTL